MKLNLLFKTAICLLLSCCMYSNMKAQAPCGQLISPTNNATGVTRTPTFTWNSLPGTAYYYVTFNYGASSGA